jgi:hypothetical protein
MKMAHRVKRGGGKLEARYDPVLVHRSRHDGLEREFKFFNRLEGGVCTTRALGGSKKI